MQPPIQQPYMPPPQPRGGFPWVAIIIGGCGCMVFACIILGAILVPVFVQARNRAREVSCVSNGRMLAVAAQMYAADHKGKLPHAAGWMDELGAYAPERAFHCPSVSGVKTGKYGYAYNSALDDKALSELQQSGTDVMIFDSSDVSRNASDNGSSLPQPGRHSGQNVVVFVDGHVKASSASSLDPVQ